MSLEYYFKSTIVSPTLHDTSMINQIKAQVSKSQAQAFQPSYSSQIHDIQVDEIFKTRIRIQIIRFRKMKFSRIMLDWGLQAAMLG